MTHLKNAIVVAFSLLENVLASVLFVVVDVVRHVCHTMIALWRKIRDLKNQNKMRYRF